MAETLSSISCTEPSGPGRERLSKWKSLFFLPLHCHQCFETPGTQGIPDEPHQISGGKKCSQQKIGFYDEEAG